VTLRPPGGVRISALTMLRHGLVPFALRHGPAAVKRLLWLKETYDVLETVVSRGAPHWHVHMMAVAPALQRRGVGTRLLASVLARADRERPRASVVSTTHLHRNVVYYRRAGFEVFEERTLLPPNGLPYSAWSMRRDA
jgi:GNAT superfamily N-acetyltransferase